jgi:Kef-type K+ transport system membrane component KefB
MFFILAACRSVGLLAQRFGQPQVVGEMIAGVLLGPSFFGLLWPEAQNFIFPPETLKTLYVGAQLGVGLYMFLVGIEFKTELFKKHSTSAMGISIAGMTVPFIVGGALAYWLVEIPGLFSPKLHTVEAMMFVGACIAITAFPMLARIIYEQGLTGTSLGTLALAAGAIDDAVAWCVLALVLAMFGGGSAVAVMAIGGGVLYSLLMIFAGPYALSPLGRWASNETGISPTLLGVVLMLVMLAAWAMDIIGIHAVFGGFLLGVVMPRGVLTGELKKQLEPFTVVFLLPMFFTYSGLNTRLDNCGACRFRVCKRWCMLGCGPFGGARQSKRPGNRRTDERQRSHGTDHSKYWFAKRPYLYTFFFHYGAYGNHYYINGHAIICLVSNRQISDALNYPAINRNDLPGDITCLFTS